MWTTPFFAEAARIYSESEDQPMLDIQLSAEAAEETFERGKRRIDWDGFESTSHDLDIWNETDLRTMSLSCTAVSMKWAPGLNATSDPLYDSVKSIADRTQVRYYVITASGLSSDRSLDTPSSANRVLYKQRHIGQYLVPPFRFYIPSHHVRLVQHAHNDLR